MPVSEALQRIVRVGNGIIVWAALFLEARFCILLLFTSRRLTCSDLFVVFYPDEGHGFFGCIEGGGGRGRVSLDPCLCGVGLQLALLASC